MSRADEVVITGIGALLPGCQDLEVLWTQLSQMRSQISIDTIAGHPGRHPMGRIDPAQLEPLREWIPERFLARYPLDIRYYLASVMLARRAAKLDWPTLVPDRVALFDGSSRGSLAFWHERLSGGGPIDPVSELMHGTPGQAASIAAALLEVEGPVLTVSNTCSSGSVAIGQAYQEVVRGSVDVALGSGHEAALIEPIYRTYGGAELLAKATDDPSKALRPYGGASRNVFGEGAVTLVLERGAYAHARGAPILARIRDYANGNFGRHPTDIDASGARPARLISGLLERNGLHPRDIDAVVGHGNGMPASDESERRYMKQVFGADVGRVPLISVKPIYGHLLGASSALNIAVAALMVSKDRVIGTLNAPPRPDRPTEVTHQPTPDQPCKRALAVSFGIGGHNTAVLVEAAA